MKRATLCLLLLAAPILSAGQTDAPVRRPEIRVGDSWTYRSTNVIALGTDEHETRVTFADDKVILTVSTRKSDGKELDASWTPEWNGVMSYSGNMFRPNSGFFRFPLRVGDAYEWSYETLLNRDRGVLNSLKWRLTVSGWDTVDVPAGKFRAIKMEAAGVGQPFDGTAPFEIRASIWYEPEVRRWVKYQYVYPTFTRSEELLRYKLTNE